MNPYLEKKDRLNDVLAAIQCLGSYRRYKLSFAMWADRICGDENKASHWEGVFKDHPEFFRIDQSEKNASLVWRRQHLKRYCVKQGRELSHGEFDDLSDEEKKLVSRVPLAADDIHALMKTAIDLHARALEQRRDQRWWLPLATAGAALLGSLAGSAF